MHDENGVRHHHAGRHVDQHGIRKERIIEEDQGVPAHLDLPHHVFGVGNVGGAAERKAWVLAVALEIPRLAVVHQHLARQ